MRCEGFGAGAADDSGAHGAPYGLLRRCNSWSSIPTRRRAPRAARDHIQSIRDNLGEIEQEEQRLVRAGMRLEGWA